MTGASGTPEALQPAAESILLVSSVGHAHGWIPHGITLLKGYIEAFSSFKVENLALSLEFSHKLAQTHPWLVTYDQDMGEWGTSVHELYFAARYFGHADPEELLRATFVDQLEGRDIYQTAPWEPKGSASPSMVAFHVRRALEFCRLIEAYSRERLMGAIARRTPVLLGLSCMVQQVYTSMWLARMAREAQPGITLVAGGPVFTAKTAPRYLEMFPEIDCIVYGDGEEPLLEIARAVAAGKRIPRSPGILGRAQRALGDLAPARAPELDKIPAPDYEELGPLLREGAVPATTWLARGCSWGRCAFCAIPDFQRSFFHRSPERVYEDIVHIAERHGVKSFRFGDWEVNGDPDKLLELCALLAAGGHGFRFWAEVNARSLTRSMLEAMKRAGFFSVQVGIEGFSTPLLQKMKKPATVLENVRCLLYAHEVGISVFSNLLYNFPGEEPSDIAETLRVMRLLRHLIREPVRLVLLEFLLEEEADVHETLYAGAAEGPAPYAFDLRCLPASLQARAPFFLRRFPRAADPRWRDVAAELSENQAREAVFMHRDAGDAILLHDKRFDLREQTLSGREAAVYRSLIGRIAPLSRVEAEHPELTRAEIEQILSGFTDSGLALRYKNNFLALSTSWRPSSGAAA
jgi:uncharacterized Fe-S cluster-containing radical SAM superfamily protein